MKERWRTNDDKTNATYETTDAHAKKNNYWRGFNQFYSSKTLPSIILRSK